MKDIDFDAHITVRYTLYRLDSERILLTIRFGSCSLFILIGPLCFRICMVSDVSEKSYVCRGEASAPKVWELRTVAVAEGFPAQQDAHKRVLFWHYENDANPFAE